MKYNKLLTAQDIFKSYFTDWGCGFNSAVHGYEFRDVGRNQGLLFMSGFNKASDMINKGEIYSIVFGDCPRCGTKTHPYGGGWSCGGMYCTATGRIPDNWRVKIVKDGNMFCCIGENFTNLQEMPAGFGATREESFNEFQKELKSLGQPSK